MFVRFPVIICYKILLILYSIFFSNAITIKINFEIYCDLIIFDPMNWVRKLEEIVAIRSGMVVPKTSNKDERLLPDAFVRMIGTSDFDEDLNLRKDLEPNVLYKEIIEKNYLKENEILFNAKGNRFFAYLFRNDYEYAIASAVFLILTVVEKGILPEYLVWYLNHPETLKIFESKKTSQSVPAITKQELSQLEVSIPDLETQKKIVELDILKKKKIHIQRKLITLEEAYINALTFKTIRNGK